MGSIAGFRSTSELTRKADDETMSARGKLTNSSPIKKWKRQKVNIVIFYSSHGCQVFIQQVLG